MLQNDKMFIRLSSLNTDIVHIVEYGDEDVNFLW
jgi:hypothetical protein